jgi:hypothetical protein
MFFPYTLFKSMHMKMPKIILTWKCVVMILYFVIGPPPTSSPPGRSNMKIRRRPIVTTTIAIDNVALPTVWHGLHYKLKKFMAQ